MVKFNYRKKLLLCILFLALYEVLGLAKFFFVHQEIISTFNDYFRAASFICLFFLSKLVLFYCFLIAAYRIIIRKGRYNGLDVFILFLTGVTFIHILSISSLFQERFILNLLT